MTAGFRLGLDVLAQQGGKAGNAAEIVCICGYVLGA
jgi:hypothetical protein